MSTEPSIRGIVNEHFAVLGSVAVILLAVLRVYYFAAFDESVAFSILSVANRTQIVVSTLLNSLLFLSPLLMINPFVRRWLMAGHANNATTSAILRTAFISLPIMSLALTTFSLPLLIGWVIAPVTYWIIRKARARIYQRKNSVAVEPQALSQRNIVWVSATILGLAFMIGLNAPWEPLEKITFSGSQQVYGYVIGEQGGKTLIVDRLKRVKWIDDSAISSRDVCGTEKSLWQSPLMSLIAHAGGGTPCPASIQ